LPAGWGEIWLHTGRIELTDSEVRWLAEGPALAGIRLRNSDASEISDGLSSLPTLVAAPPSSWPSADLSVAAEDIDIAQTATTIGITAVIKNTGNAHSRGVLVMVNAVTSPVERGISRSFVVDVPREGMTEIKLSVPFSAPYGAVLVHAMQISEHTPYDVWTPDPTPNDTVAFRIIGPTRAPQGFAASLIEQCGPICRGF